MTPSTHSATRLVAALAVASALFAWAAGPALSFDGRSLDTQLAVSASAGQPAPTFDGRSVDTRFGTQVGGGVDLRSPDPREGVKRDYSTTTPIDMGSPDSREASLPRRSATPQIQTSPLSGNGFQWDDFAIGVAASVGSIALLAGLAAAMLAARRRHRGTELTVG